ESAWFDTLAVRASRGRRAISSRCFDRAARSLHHGRRATMGRVVDGHQRSGKEELAMWLLINFIAALAYRDKDGKLNPEDKRFFVTTFKAIALVAAILLAAKVSLWLALPIVVIYAVTLIRDE